jgi:hypothetical protein
LPLTGSLRNTKPFFEGTNVLVGKRKKGKNKSNIPKEMG